MQSARIANPLGPNAIAAAAAEKQPTSKNSRINLQFASGLAMSKKRSADDPAPEVRSGVNFKVCPIDLALSRPDFKLH